MEPTPNTPRWLSKENLQVIREFFAWLLVIFFIYQNKQLQAEIAAIYKAQIQVLTGKADTESKQLQIIDKILNEKTSNNNTTKPLPDNDRE